ncbi:helix-turn-helix transcriptional regulator (plasmid) [Cyanobacterium sp. IPPAS B-1200]|uniref:helix-turn-helix transcriptional regulator n=1 Tax=Cyanobacterium sp. IPPAS B-1200 TaxID=1562720 RepID=UPI00085260A8|nr:WYL domain-containing protein [Cyanobacterium sp. IPPAS B-1200]OEJ80040.1 WYL domain-containing protein [Cyanobacterium sp. IPPAS B-1200]
MAKTPQLHRYSDQKSFQRLMLLIATIVNHPNLTQENDEEPTNSLSQLQQEINNTASEYDVQLDKPAISTLRKDLETLKKYGILERRMYRWGYYLGTGVMTKAEFKVAFDALESMANYQGDAIARKIYRQLRKRIKGLQLDHKTDFFYPIRRNLNRAINYTDPEEMFLKGNNQNTLYHHISSLEKAIIKGQAIEVSRPKDYYNQGHIGIEIIIPLQLIYYNIAWYLIYENCANGQIIIGRLNRFSDYFHILSTAGRNILAQKESLKKAEQLLINGWGLNLGNLEEQELELKGELLLEKIKVRFYPPIADLIIEGDLRHPKQRIKVTKNQYNGQISFVDYFISLPPRSLNEFLYWLQKYSSSVEVVHPQHLRKRHEQGALQLYQRYQKMPIV